jgi:transcriptional regulator with XRE-family HTH domain
MGQRPDRGPLNKSIGGRLKMARTLRGLSQEALAERLGGISFQQLQKYENGTNMISASRLKMAADTLMLPLSFFYANNGMTADGYNKDNVRLAHGFTKIRSRALRNAILRMIREAAKEAEANGRG